MALPDNQASILRFIESLPEGVHKEVCKKVVPQLFSKKNGARMNIDEQLIKELKQTISQSGSSVSKRSS